MTEFKIDYTDIREVEAWCLRFIGPRMYYLPKKIGGQGWSIVRQFSPTPTVTIENDKQALMAMLKFGK